MELESGSRQDFLSACRKDDINRVLVFLKSPVSRPYDHEINLAFVEACKAGAVEVVRLFLLEKWINVEGARDAHDGKTGLLAACSSSGTSPALVSLLLQSPRVDVNAVDAEGRTALMLATMSGVPQIVKLLLSDHRTDVSARDRNLDTAYHMACSKGHLSTLELLLKVSSVDTTARNAQGQTGYDLANDTTQVFLRAALVARNLAGMVGMVAASRKPTVAAAAAGADNNNKPASSAAEDPSVARALYLACTTNDLAALQELLSDPRIDPNIGLHPSARSSDRPLTPLIAAIIRRYRIAVSLLLAHPRIEAGRPVLSIGPHTPLENYFITPLSEAIRTMQPGMVRLLLAHPTVDPNTPLFRDEKYMTALSLIIHTKHNSQRAAAAATDIFTAILLNNKTDPNVQDPESGNTAWHTSSPRILPYLPVLLRHAENRNIDLTLLNKEGLTCVDYWHLASKGGNKSLEEWIGREGWEVLAQAGVWKEAGSVVVSRGKKGGGKKGAVVEEEEAEEEEAQAGTVETVEAAAPVVAPAEAIPPIQDEPATSPTPTAQLRSSSSTTPHLSEPPSLPDIQLDAHLTNAPSQEAPPYLTSSELTSLQHFELLQFDDEFCRDRNEEIDPILEQEKLEEALEELVGLLDQEDADKTSTSETLGALESPLGTRARKAGIGKAEGTVGVEGAEERERLSVREALGSLQHRQAV